MGEDPLQFSKIKFLPFGTGIHQTDDGTIYYNGGSPRRLYVQHNKEKIDIDTCDEFKANDCADFKALGVNGETLYFTTNGQLYQAAFPSKSHKFEVDLCRDLLESETPSVKGFCRRTMDGKSYAYRICDDPESDRILIDDDVECRPLIAVHRNRAYYSTQVQGLTEPSIRNLFDEVYVVEFPFTFVIPHTRESSRYIYFIDGHRRHPSAPITDKNKFENFWTHKNLHTLDTETMEFFPPVAFDTGYTKITNYSVLNGTVTMAGSKDHDRDFDVFSGKDSTKDAILPPYDYCLMEAELPDGYFDMIPDESVKVENAVDEESFENASAEEVHEETEVLDEIGPYPEESDEDSDESSDATITLNSDEYEEGIVREILDGMVAVCEEECEDDITVNDIPPDYAPDEVPDSILNEDNEVNQREEELNDNHDHQDAVIDENNDADKEFEEHNSQQNDNTAAELAGSVPEVKTIDVI